MQQVSLDKQQMPMESMEERDEYEIEQIESSVRDSEIEIEFAEARRQWIGKQIEGNSQIDLNNVPSLRAIDSVTVKTKTRKINEILINIRLSNIDDIHVIKEAAILVNERVDLKRKRKKQKDPFWKRHIENDIGKLRKDLSRIEAWFKGN